MKKNLLYILTISLFLLSCEKIQERRLIGIWFLTEWSVLTDSARVDVLTTFPAVGFDVVEVQFFKNHDFFVFTYNNGNQTGKYEGIWEESGKFDYLEFPDTVFLFDPGKQYEVIQLMKGKLRLKGPYTVQGITFPECEWEFDKR